MLTGEDLQDMGLDDFCTRLELLVHVTQECNNRALDEVAAAVEGLTEREGEQLAGVREAPLIDDEDELHLRDVAPARAEAAAEDDEDAAGAQAEPTAQPEPAVEADAEMADAAHGEQAGGAGGSGAEAADGTGDAVKAHGGEDDGALDAAPAGAQDVAA